MALTSIFSILAKAEVLYQAMFLHSLRENGPRQLRGAMLGEPSLGSLIRCFGRERSRHWLTVTAISRKPVAGPAPTPHPLPPDTFARHSGLTPVTRPCYHLFPTR
jgi:hypothetical protein